MSKIRLTFLLGLATVVLTTLPSPAAPALGDKPVKYEYAELQARMTVARVAILPGGVAPAAPAAQPAQGIRWTTGEDEITFKSWEELAEKLKAPAKKDATITQHKMRVLNQLGAEGWEMVSHTGTDGTTGLATWTFKRRLP
jgi:sugar phosphate isomerase/epimerase